MDRSAIAEDEGLLIRRLTRSMQLLRHAIHRAPMGDRRATVSLGRTHLSGPSGFGATMDLRAAGNIFGDRLSKLDSHQGAKRKQQH